MCRARPVRPHLSPKQLRVPSLGPEPHGKISDGATEARGGHVEEPVAGSVPCGRRALRQSAHTEQRGCKAVRAGGPALQTGSTTGL